MGTLLIAILSVCCKCWVDFIMVFHSAIIFGGYRKTTIKITFYENVHLFFRQSSVYNWLASTLLHVCLNCRVNHELLWLIDSKMVSWEAELPGMMSEARLHLCPYLHIYIESGRVSVWRFCLKFYTIPAFWCPEISSGLLYFKVQHTKPLAERMALVINDVLHLLHNFKYSPIPIVWLFSVISTALSRT